MGLFTLGDPDAAGVWGPKVQEARASHHLTILTASCAGGTQTRTVSGSPHGQRHPEAPKSVTAKIRHPRANTM